MKNKLDIAHDFSMGVISNPSVTLGADNIKNIIKNAWQYADEMYKQMQEREPKGLPDALQDDFEVDWRIAPDWANYWAMDESGDSHFCKNRPKIEFNQWVYYSAYGEKSTHLNAPNFNYKGDWRNSLRKRPE